METFGRWLKEPSTWKAFTILLGVIGYTISPERIGEILISLACVYSGIALFFDRG